MAFLSADGVRVAQADPGAQPSAAPDPSVLAQPDLATLTPSPAAMPSPSPEARRDPSAGLPYLSGIDVSHHNGDIDFERVREAGYHFAFLKVTQDNDFLDPMFATNLDRARAAGLAAGGYHFFDYTLDGRDQADHFLDRLEATAGLEDALPPVVDVECWPPIGASIHAVSAARLRDLVDRIWERTGRLPIIYTSALMWKEVVGNAEGFSDLPLWAACWDCAPPPSIAEGWSDWTFWQTGIDRIKGVGSLDGNYFSGTTDDLAALRLRPVSIEGGVPVTSREEVEIDLGGRSATHVRTSTEGEAWSRWVPVRGRVTARLEPREGSQALRVQLRRGPKLKSPVFSDTITLDRSGPQVSVPAVRLALEPLADGARIPVNVTWEASDDVSGLADASVSMACDGGRAALTEAPGSAEPGARVPWTATAAVDAGASCVATVVGRDGAGNASRVRADPVVATLVEADGERPTASVQGLQVGVTARRGPDQGRAALLLDGEPVGFVDLYAPQPGDPEIVLVLDLEPGAAGTVSVEPTGTSDAASSGSAVSLEGFVVLEKG
jgi:GH25 family lysozyme M1 (1,4-beta-N-acetylmuramidase)